MTAPSVTATAAGSAPQAVSVSVDSLVVLSARTARWCSGLSARYVHHLVADRRSRSTHHPCLVGHTRNLGTEFGVLVWEGPDPGCALQQNSKMTYQVGGVALQRPTVGR